MLLRSWVRQLFTRSTSVRKAQQSCGVARYRLTFEQLETRITPATFTVINTNQAGAGSLSQAILDANARSGLDTIVFNIPGAPTTVHTIGLTTPLPDITDPVIINGYTQPGAVQNTDPNESNAQLRIQLDMNSGNEGITIKNGGSGSRIAGLSIFSTVGSNASAILLNGAIRVNVDGNFLGLRADGTAANQMGMGVELRGGYENEIGGTTVAERNVITNFRIGIGINAQSTNNQIEGNLIGTNAAGTATLGTQRVGVQVRGSGNDIGTAAGRNVISGNTNYGVELLGPSNDVTGNFIGVGRLGLGPLGNGIAGVRIEGVDAEDNRIGTGNIISGNNTTNTEDGGGIVAFGAANVSIVGNRIGTNVDGNAAIANNRNGVLIRFSKQARIGGVAVGSMNIISGNDGHGVHITSQGSFGAVIQRNRIGTNADGNAAIGNTGAGIYIHQSVEESFIGTTENGTGNLISGNLSHGILIAAFAKDIDILGNIIGLTADGDAALGNQGDGINIQGGGTMRVYVGLGTRPTRNTISANAGDGIEVNQAKKVTIAGNLIGTNDNGTVDLGNGQHGINLQDPDDTVIGRPADKVTNVISGNTMAGISVDNRAGNTVIEDNIIGLSENEKGLLGNGTNGIQVMQNSFKTRIGGGSDATANVIGGNAENGILLGQRSAETTVLRNYIGVARSNDAPLDRGNDGFGIFILGSNRNVIGEFPKRGNFIQFNTLGSIRVEANGVVGSANFNTIRANQMSGGGAAIILIGGANNNAIAPVLNDLINRQRVIGTLIADPNRTYTIDLYGVTASGLDIFVDAFQVTTAADGVAVINIFTTQLPAVATSVRVTATSPGGNTSVLSNGVI